MAIWNFHGAKDDIVPSSGSENMVNAVRRYNRNVRYTLYPDANHNSWDVTYNNDSIYLWLLSQKKFQYQPKHVNAQILKEYAGWYVGADKDSVQILLENNSLIAKPENQTVPLQAAGDNLFFMNPGRLMDLQFIKNRNKVTGFIFMGDRKMLYSKIGK